MRFENILSKAEELSAFDTEVRGGTRGWLAGVDEAGRGALAGPVVAAAVVLPQGSLIPGVYDSKHLSPERREELLVEIQKHALAVSWAQVGPEIIDRINILKATHEAMRRSVAALARKPGLAVIDGRPVPDFPCRQVAVVKGDGKSLSVAAASIVAKVFRDKLMVALGGSFPRYNFSSNKGYASREHVRAIKQHGPCSCHRKSFSPIAPGKAGAREQIALPLGA